MHRRYFFVLFVFLYAELSIAGTHAWDCKKIKTGGWDCGSKEVAPATVINKPVPLTTKSNLLPVESTAISQVAEAKAIEAAPKKEASGLFSAVFTGKQEQIFEILHSQLKFDPWDNCQNSASNKSTYTSDNNLRNTAPMDVTADYSEIYDNEVTQFFGNVDIIRADQRVQSDQANYNTSSGTMDAQGHVFYNENEMSLYSNTALLNLDSDEARLREALFISPSGPIRGRADVVYRDSPTLFRYKNAAFTSCRPGNEDWVIQADRLKMNQITGKASAKSAWLKFKKVPVLYIPYISFPVDDRRISGLLPPTFSATGENGLDISVPFYWNIAPDYDLTIWPRYMAKRGVMLGGEFRHLTKRTVSSLALEYLPDDKIRNKQRYAGSFKNDSQIVDNLRSHVDVNYVSDKSYFDELNNTLGLSNDSFLRSDANLNYNSDYVTFATNVQAYQTIDKNVIDDDKPYQKLPQVTLNFNHSFDELPLDIGLDNEYVYFYREGRVSGQRFNTKPSIGFPMETAGTFFKPNFSLQHTEYFLENQVAGKSNSISRTLPIISVDSGLFFEKNLEVADSKFMHTIEPRLFYLYIPEKEQADIPVFDSALYDFGFSSLFRENRFSGTDRVQDANQISVAITTRLVDSDNGLERLNLSVGEIFYFKDRNVTLPGERVETNSLSNIVAELSGQLTDTVSYRTGLQWNPDVNDVTRGQAELRYRGGEGKLLNLGYRYRKDQSDLAISDNGYIIQTDASIRWPIYDNWYGVGRWQYSLKHNSTKESFLGIEKESCCWRFRALWRKYANTITGSSDDETETGVFLQIEFKGLTGFGDKVDVFLEKNLKGYGRAE